MRLPVLIALYVVLKATQAFSADGGSSGRFEAFMSSGFLGISKSASQYDLAPGFSYKPIPSFSWLQVGGEVTYQKLSYQDQSVSHLLFLGGVTANVGTAIQDAFFVSLGLALRAGGGGSTQTTSAELTSDPNGFGFYFFAGKRFPLAGAFSLRPSMGVVSVGTTGMVFRPFAVSYSF